jgi:hypothetical protein
MRSFKQTYQKTRHVCSNNRAEVRQCPALTVFTGRVWQYAVHLTCTRNHTYKTQTHVKSSRTLRIDRHVIHMLKAKRPRDFIRATGFPIPRLGFHRPPLLPSVVRIHHHRDGIVLAVPERAAERALPAAAAGGAIRHFSLCRTCTACTC